MAWCIIEIRPISTRSEISGLSGIVIPAVPPNVLTCKKDIS